MLQRFGSLTLILNLLIYFFAGCSIQPQQEPESEQAKRPNIVLIMADDMGFSDIGAYGGEIETPSLDGLAKNGLRYTQFYNNARCCPTRASLLTGVYPQQAGMGWMTAADLGTPEYQGELNNKSVTIAEVLKDAGYATYMTGKWHLSRGRNNRAGIKTHWPSQRGFERFFGIIGGASNYFTPVVYSDNDSYKAPDNFYFTHAISDSSVMFIDQHLNKSEKAPFFMYVAYTAPHWPLHALEKDIEKYKGRYKAGWDKLRFERLQKQKEIGIFDNSVELSERDSRVPAWNTLSENEQEEFAMRMAIYAAQVDAMDQGIGRIVNKLEAAGELDNTLIFFLSDNGACAEYISSGKSKEVNGKANTYESYRIHWANLGSTPYREYKHWIHEGGIATPLIVHWPEGIDTKNEFVREPGHINDIMATCVAVAGADYPSTFRGNVINPMEGQSLLPHFNGRQNNREPIYWEHEGNIGLRDGKWKLVAKTEEGEDFNPANLELYNMDEDPAELNNLVKQNPEKMQELFNDWKKWADRVNVHLDTRKYNHRALAYQRMINGEFDELHAGWKFSGKQFDFTIDTTDQMSGKFSAKITSLADGGTANLRWPFAVNEGEAFDVKLKVKSTGDARVKGFLTHVRSGETYLAEDAIQAQKSIQEVSFNTKPAYENGRHLLAIEIEGLKRGESVWIDQVELKEIHSDTLPQ